MPNITLALLKTPRRRKRLFLVDEILRGSPAAPDNMILALLKTPWRKKRSFLVEGIVSGGQQHKYYPGPLEEAKEEKMI